MSKQQHLENFKPFYSNKGNVCDGTTPTYKVYQHSEKYATSILNNSYFIGCHFHNHTRVFEEYVPRGEFGRGIDNNGLLMVEDMHALRKYKDHPCIPSVFARNLQLR